MTNGRLYDHNPHPHEPRNVAVIHKQERDAGGFNTRLAVWLTMRVGSMWAAYLFVMIACIGLLAILGVLTPIVALLVAWVSQTCIQLVLLPVIMVGQNVLDRRAELLAEEQFYVNSKSLHEASEIMHHLEAQDTELLRQTTMILDLLQKLSTEEEL